MSAAIHFPWRAIFAGFSPCFASDLMTSFSWLRITPDTMSDPSDAKALETELGKMLGMIREHEREEDALVKRALKQA